MTEALAGEMVVADLDDECRQQRHRADRPVDQRQGPTGALPVNPGGSIYFFSFLVSAGLSFCAMVEVNPT